MEYHLKFNKDSRNALIGVVLGDGYLGKSGECTILHCSKQLDYLTWKVEYLRSVGYKCSDIKYKDNNGSPAYKVYVHGTPWGKLLRSIVYGSTGARQSYNRKLLNRLEPVHIAMWYMDDGGLSQKKRRGKVHANDLMLNTHTSRENNQILIDYFLEVWGIQFTQVKNRGHYRLRCGTREARKFLDIVREYVSQIPSMAHKLNIK